MPGWEKRRPQRSYESLSHRDGQFLVHPGQEHEEFFAAVAGHVIVIAPYVFLDNAGDLDQTAIALSMAEMIVQLLEVVNVAHQHSGTVGAFSATAP
ncbi:hypothetical protein AJ88_12465 [Mesorhizobium amorphae CCBAU 01583]|nr:hypothetical protein AJ88_12465 [Mesorhizobium amorphae CCBAU 01583]